MAINTKYISNKPKEYLVVTAKNVKAGDTTNNNPYRTFGLQIQSGPRAGKWVNYFFVVSPNRKERYKKDCKIMGILNDSPEGFRSDGRKFTAIWAEEEYKGKVEFKVVAVTAYDASKYPQETVAEGTDDDTLPF